MEALIMTGQLILALAILVTLHEWGHFVAARAFGIKVEKFYLFFDAWGIKLFKFKKGDTEYGIGWLPLGGYVKIAGMIDESVDKEQLKKPAEEWEFRSKPRWQRLIVMLAGVTVNVILGIIIVICTTAFYGEKVLPPANMKYGIHADKLGQEIGLQDGDLIWGVNGDSIEGFKDILSPDVLFDKNAVLEVTRNGENIHIPLPPDFLDKFTDYAKDSGFIDVRNKFWVASVTKKGEAEKAGIQKKDNILMVNGTPTYYFNDFQEILQENKGKTVELTVLRGTDTLQLTSAVTEEGTIGIGVEFEDLGFVKKNYNIGEAIPLGTKKAFDNLYQNIRGFGKLFSGDVNPANAVQGPIRIAQIFGGVWNWQNFWYLTATLSLVLAFMNVLPIPALDGGHAMFLIFEMITGKELSEKFLTAMQVIGMVILLTLMVLIFGNDIYSTIFK